MKGAVNSNMKRAFKAAIGIVLSLSLGLSVSAAAADVTIYNDIGKVEQISIEMPELSVAGTMSRDEARIIVKSYIEAPKSKKYNIICKTDDKTYNVGIMNAAPYRNEEKAFGLSMLENGVHNAVIEVKDGSRVVDSISQRIVIMDGYEHQFMDELSGYGVNTHIENSANCYDDIEIDRLVFSGIKNIREQIAWRRIERVKGVYNWGKYFNPATSKSRGFDGFWKYLQKHGINHYRLLGYGNPFYRTFPTDDPNDIEGSKQARGVGPWSGGDLPTIPEGIYGWKNYVTEAVSHFGTNNYEIFNEVQLQSRVFPKRAGNANTYTNLLKFSTMGKIETNYDANINGFSIDQAGHWHLTESLAQGVYPYLNTAGLHTYTRPYDPDRNNSYRNELKNVDDEFTKYGGWKDSLVNEVGWVYYDGDDASSGYTTSELAAKYLVKMMVLGDAENLRGAYWYNYNKYRKTKAELKQYEKQGLTMDPIDNFGLFDIWDRPQKPYLTFANLNNQIAGAIYVGEVSLGLGESERAFLYSKDGEPVLVAWYYDVNNGSVELNLGEKTEITDLYGNTVISAGGTLTLDNNPVYIKGLSKTWFEKCTVEALKKSVKNYIADYSLVFDNGFTSKVNDTLKNSEKSIEADTTADTILAEINKLAALGDEIIAKGAAGELSELDTSKTLYQLYKIMCKLDNAYIALYDGEAPQKLENNIDALTDKVNTLYRNDKRLMQYTDEMYRHTKRFYDNAKTVMALEDNPQKAGVVKGYDLMTGIMLRWTNAFADFESVMRYSIIMQVPYSELVSTAGLTQNINLSVFNFENDDINGYVKLIDDLGNEVTRSDKLTVTSGYHVTVPMSFMVDKREGVENYYYKAAFYDENDSLVKEDTVVFIIADNVEVRMRPINTTADKAKSLTFSIKNLSTKPFDLKLNIKSNEDVTFAKSSVSFSIDAGATADVSVPISSMTNTEYHYYLADYSLEMDDGTVIYKAAQPINFSCIVKSESKLDMENYDGGLEGWEDAYPIYINPPKDSASENAWQSSTCSARILYKWDSNNLYMICDVYDNVFMNWLANSDMWNGDCLQMSFDVGNDKTTSYDKNDIDLGFAYTSALEQFWVWQSPTPYTGPNNVSWSHIIRNDDKKLTRYVAAIPSSVLTDLKLASGTEFGYNVGLNDADLLYREYWYQFTNGTIDSKNPSLYETFSLIDFENKELKPSKSSEIFEGTLESKLEKKIPFTDVYGHWAENQITSLYNSGIVNGKSETVFDTSGTLTRAEFMQMAAKVSGKTAGIAYNIYSDTDTEAWYARSVQILYENDIIPDEMTENNQLKPDMEITREEAAVIAYNVYRAVKNKTTVSGNMDYAADADKVSEWAKESIDKAIALGFIEGDDMGMLNPQGFLTRAEGAAIIFRLMGKVL